MLRLILAVVRLLVFALSTVGELVALSVSGLVYFMLALLMALEFVIKAAVVIGIILLVLWGALSAQGL